MPQLDITTYHTQIVWLWLVIYTLYYVLSTHILPIIAVIVKFRRMFAKKRRQKIRLHHREIRRSSDSDILIKLHKLLKLAVASDSVPLSLPAFDYSPLVSYTLRSSAQMYVLRSINK
jgi:hypothetical protein